VPGNGLATNPVPQRARYQGKALEGLDQQFVYLAQSNTYFYRLDTIDCKSAMLLRVAVRIDIDGDMMSQIFFSSIF
jgi:hypothetical protein